MALCEKILIAGFSGSGKTTLLRALKSSAPENWENFDDLDQLVLTNRGRGFKNLAALIEAKGWETFRLWERQELEGWLKTEGRGVLALGGGSVSPLILELYGNARKCRFLHLQTSFETCWQRLTQDAEIRPLVLKGEQEFHELFELREKIFSQIPWKLSGEAEINTTVQKIWDALKS